MIRILAYALYARLRNSDRLPFKTLDGPPPPTRHASDEPEASAQLGERAPQLLLELGLARARRQHQPVDAGVRRRQPRAVAAREREPRCQRVETWVSVQTA